MKLRKEEYSKQYEYRKLRALYGTRISTRILRGVIEEKELSDESLTKDPAMVRRNTIKGNSSSNID